MIACEVWLLVEQCWLILLRVKGAVDVNTIVAASPSPWCKAQRWHLFDGYLFDELTGTVQFADPGVGQDKAVVATREGSISFAVEWHFKLRRLLPEFRPMAILCPDIRAYPGPAAFPANVATVLPLRHLSAVHDSASGRPTGGCKEK